MAEVQAQRKVNTEADRLKDSLTLPPPPAARCKWEQALAYFNLLTEEQKEMIKWYLYRQKPAIIKPKPFYIQEPSYGLPDYDTIVALHGGGNYRLDIQDGGKAKKIMEVFLTIPMTNAPKIDLEELDMNDPSNKGYINQLVADGKITRDGQVINSNQPQQSNNTVPEAMARMQSDFMNIFMKMNESQQRQLMEAASKKDELGGTVGNILIEKMKQDNPNNFMTVLVEMLKQQKSTAGDFQPMFAMMGTMMANMVTMSSESSKALQAAQAENTKILLEMMREKTTVKKEGEDEDGLGGGSFIEKMRAMMEFAREIKGGKGAEKSTVEIVMDGISSVGPPILDVVGKALQFAMMNKGGVPAGLGGMPPGPSMASSLPRAAQPGDIYRNGPPAPPESSKVVAMPTPQAQPETGVQQLTPIQRVQQLIATQGPLIFNHLANSGAAFAAWIEDGFGKPTWAMMAQFEEDLLVEGAKTVPDFWNQVSTTYGESYFRKWIQDFKNYEEILAKEEGEEEGE